MFLLFAISLAFASAPQGREFTNSLGMKFVRVEPGSFLMGESNTIPENLIAPLTYPARTELVKRFPKGDPRKFVIPTEGFRRGDYDERPVHKVRISRPFYAGVFEVTNAQYERFDPSHRALRGKNGFSKADDEAVVFVSWEDAKAFCDWLSKKEGLPYRLPTEAEWEYAARAGTTTLFWTGEALPSALLKNARSTDFREPEDKVSLAVGAAPANPWGLHDVLGNVEEWCQDWYGLYSAREQTDPAGRADGDFRVIRGGSHGSDPYYLRSANRMGSLPETRHWIIGFRVVLGPPPSAPAPAAAPAAVPPVNSARQAQPVDPAQPYFKGPRRYVRTSPDAHGPVYAHHNHDTAIAECPNGDLFAIWYTCEQERGREVAVASSRLRRGADQWEPAQGFWDTPDRNDHCPALWYDGKDTLYHINGLGVAGKWSPLAIVLRTSRDNGYTWTKARAIVPEFGFRQMVGWPVFRTKDGSIVFGADAGRGSTVYVSRDEGRTWADSGGHIRGIHAAIAEGRDGRLIAYGRGEEIDGFMSVSYSHDLGKNWKSEPSIFPPIGGGQRAVLLRLKEGALFFASFAEDVNNFQPSSNEYARRAVSSLFGAVSFDEGKTWPLRRVISPGIEDRPAETINGGRIRMSANWSEPQGYLSVCQSRDGVIQLLSSISHYAFNLAWLKQGQPEAPRMPREKSLAARPKLGQTWARVAPEGSNERDGTFDSLNAAKGFSIEMRTQPGRAATLDVYARSSALMASRYSLRLTADAVEYWFDGEFRKVAGAGGEAPAKRTYRLAVREDTAVQIYRDGRLLATQPAAFIIDWRQPARGSYVEWSGAETLSYDLSGAYAPAATTSSGPRTRPLNVP